MDTDDIVELFMVVLFLLALATLAALAGGCDGSATLGSVANEVSARAVTTKCDRARRDYDFVALAAERMLAAGAVQASREAYLEAAAIVESNPRCFK